MTMKKIGRWQGAGLLATTLLGTGVFILPQMTIAIAQDNAIYTWILLTIAIIPVTLVFGKLAAKFPHAGGPAYFAEQAFGKTFGRSIGLIFLCIVPLGVPAAILMTLEFVHVLLPLHGWEILIAEALILALLFLLNHRGIQVSAKLQFALTLAVVALVFILLGIAFGFSPTEITSKPTQMNVATAFSLSSPILVAAGIAFWSFLGVEAMTHLSAEFEDPQNDMIPAMMIGTVIVGIVYVACTVLLLQITNDSSLQMVGAFNQLIGGEIGAIVIGIIGIAGGLATTNVYTASTARLIQSFSEQAVLPSYFAKKNNYGVPERALKLVLVAMTITLTFSYFTGIDLEHLISWVNGVFVIIYFTTMIAALKLLNGANKLSILFGCVFCVLLASGLAEKMSYAVVLLIGCYCFLSWQLKRQQAKLKPQVNGY